MKREKAEPEYDVKGRKLHMYRDPGPAIAEADYRPRISSNPEEVRAAAFIAAGRDYGGELPENFVLRAVLTPPAAHSSIEATAEAE